MCGIDKWKFISDSENTLNFLKYHSTEDFLGLNLDVFEFAADMNMCYDCAYGR